MSVGQRVKVREICLKEKFYFTHYTGYQSRKACTISIYLINGLWQFLDVVWHSLGAVWHSLPSAV